MQQANGGWQKRTNGRNLAYNKTDGFKRYQSVYFEIQPGQEALFYKHYVFDDFILSRLAGKSHLVVSIGYFEPFVKRHFIAKDDMLDNEGDVLLFGFMALVPAGMPVFRIMVFVFHCNNLLIIMIKNKYVSKGLAQRAYRL